MEHAMAAGFTYGRMGIHTTILALPSSDIYGILEEGRYMILAASEAL